MRGRAAVGVLARRLGAKPFLEAVADEKRDEADRVRAVEVLTELFDGLPAKAADAAARTPSALVRARVAWSFGRKFDPADQPALIALAGDREPRVIPLETADGPSC